MKLFQGVDCVYHMAAYGMSGREQVYFIVTKYAKELHALEGYFAPPPTNEAKKIKVAFYQFLLKALGWPVVGIFLVLFFIFVK